MRTKTQIGSSSNAINFRFSKQTLFDKKQPYSYLVKKNSDFTPSRIYIFAHNFNSNQDIETILVYTYFAFCEK